MYTEWLKFYYHQECMEALDRLHTLGVLSRDRGMRRFLCPNPYIREMAERAEEMLSANETY